MAELADAHDSKSCEEIHTGSIPVIGTTFIKIILINIENPRLYNIGFFNFYCFNTQLTTQLTKDTSYLKLVPFFTYILGVFTLLSMIF